MGDVVGHVESPNLPVEEGGGESASGEGSSGHASGEATVSPSVSAGFRPGTSVAPPRRVRTYVVVAVAIVVVVIALAYVLSGGFHHTSGSSGNVLLPHGTSYAIGGGQSTGITLTVTTPSVLAGTFQTGAWVTLYTMSPTDYASFVKTGNVTGFEWASGRISNLSYYNLNVSIPVGSWVFAFVNPNPTLSIAVTFYTDVTLTPT